MVVAVEMIAAMAAVAASAEVAAASMAVSVAVAAAAVCRHSSASSSSISISIIISSSPSRGLCSNKITTQYLCAICMRADTARMLQRMVEREREWRVESRRVHLHYQ